MKVYSFETPLLQSAKGITVIFAENLYKIIKKFFALAVIIIAGFFSKNQFFENYKSSFIIAISCFLVYMIVRSFLQYINFKFHIENNYFILHKGILKKEEITIPKAKIQNIHIKQNFIQQLLDVVALNIETAGDDDTEIEIKALSKPIAIALKEALLINNKNEVIETVESENLYFKISLKQLVLEGISENHFKSLLLVLALISGVYDTLRDLIKLSHVDSFNIETSELLNSTLFNVFLFVLLFILLLILSFLYSIIRIFTLNFNLKVVNTTSGLEISKGLFNKVSLHIKRNKIQNIRLKTNRLKKYLGLYSVRFSQIMESKKQKEYLSIIALNDLQAQKLIDKFYKGFFENFNPQKPEKYFKKVLAFQFAIPILIVNLLLYLGSSYLLLINIPMLLLLFWHIKLSYKKNYFSIDENYFIKGSGNLVDTNTDYLELKSIQSVEIKQTLFQKKRHLASVLVYSATNKLTIPHVKAESAKQIVNYLLFKIETQDKNWM